MTTAIVGVPRNRRNPAVADAFHAAAVHAGFRTRDIDLETLHLNVDLTAVADRHGPVTVTHLAPGLVYGEPRAVHALNLLEAAGAATLNPQASVAVADDKAATAIAFAAGHVPQPHTTLVRATHPSDAAAVGFPLVLKRPHGALGTWVRRVTGPEQLAQAAAELLSEGGELLVAQAEITESLGRATRVIVLDGDTIAATERVAPAGEWRSNVARGGTQSGVSLTVEERRAAQQASAAVGLGFAGVDIVRSRNGPVVLEVNANPGFTSMTGHVPVDIAACVIAAVVRQQRRQPPDDSR